MQQLINLPFSMPILLMQCSSFIRYPMYQQCMEKFHKQPFNMHALLQPKCTLFVAYVEGPSIEAHEQSARGDIHAKYTITGPSQQCPSDFNGALLLSHFKPELINFLVDEWASGKYFTVLKDHVLYFATAESCHKYCAANGLVTEDGDSGIGS